MNSNVTTKNWINLMLIVLILGISVSTKAQVFVEPRYKAKNADGVEIALVEITDDYTILNLMISPVTSLSLYVSSKTYIENSDGGEPLYIKKIEGSRQNNIGINQTIMDNANELELDKLYSDIQPTIRFLRLYFPKVSNKVNNINFRSGSDGNYWHFFEINVTSNIGVDGSVKSGRKGKTGNCSYINNPGYIAKSGGFEITKVELCDTATILHFKVNLNGGSFSVPSKSSIRDSNGGEDFFVISAEGTNMDQQITADETNEGIVYYKLFFPPIKKSVKKIDFRELNNGGNWFVYELDTDFN